MSREERSPLLQEANKNRQLYNGPVVIEDDENGNISVVVAKDDNDAEEEDNLLVKKRLNGSPLMLVLIGLWVGVGLSALDSSIVATIYPQIGTEFKRSNEIVWIATAYMLSFTALQPLYGRISDAFGRRTAYLFATVVFFVGSGLCGASTNLWALVISRAIAGIGGGGMNTMSSVITSDLVSLRERGKYQGYANIAYGLGSVVGAPLGGFLNDTVGWRFCFYMNLPLLIVSLYVGIYILRDYNLEEQTEETTLMQRFKKIDYLGAMTVVSCCICFLLATSMGGNSRAWTDPLVYSLLIASVVLGALFCYVEAKIALNPLMPWPIISARTPFACALTNFFGVMASYAVTYNTPLFFQGVMGYSSAQAGLYFIPKIIALSIGSLASGYWMARTGEYRKFIIVSAILAAISMVGTSSWSPSTPFAFICFCLVLDGYASGAIITTALVAMLSCIGKEEMATITSISYLFRSSGGVIGISAASAIFQGVLKDILEEKITGPDKAEIIEIARKSITEVRSLLPPEPLAIVLDTYAVAVRYAFYLSVVVTTLCLISTLFIQQFQLHSKVK